MSPEEQYLSRLKAGYGRRTQESALRGIERAHGSAVDWAKLDVPGALKLAEEIRGAGKAPATVSRWFCAARGVITACRAGQQFVGLPEGMSQRDWAADLLECFPVKSRQQVGNTGHAFTWEEVDSFLRMAPNPRDAAMLAVGFGAGLRQSELCDLDMEDLRPDHEKPDRLIVRDGKGGKPRVAAFVRRFNKPLQAWLKVRGPENGPVFVALHPRTGKVPENPQRIGAHGLWLAIRRISRVALTEFSTHDMRRTYATRLLEAGVPLKYVQSSLGHAEAKTTLRYQQTEEDAMVAVIGGK